MANLISVTASRGARITDVKAVTAIVDKYDYPEALVINIETDDDSAVPDLPLIEIYGHDCLDAYEHGSASGESKLDEFLSELSEFLAEPLIIQVVGHESCRFPLIACEIVVCKGKAVQFNGFKN